MVTPVSLRLGRGRRRRARAGDCDAGAVMVVGRVASLSVFPVKSTSGQSVTAAALTERGVLHDREWAVYTADGGIASGKTSRRFRKVEGLLGWRSTLPAEPGGVPFVHDPDDVRYRADDPAASWSTSRRSASAPTHPC